MSSTIGSGYFAPYYPITNHPCFQLQLYIDSAAIVLCFSCNGIPSLASPTALPSAFCHPFHVYIEALVPYQIDRVLILNCQARQLWARGSFLRTDYSFDQLFLRLVSGYTQYTRYPNWLAKKTTCLLQARTTFNEPTALIPTATSVDQCHNRQLPLYHKLVEARHEAGNRELDTRQQARHES